MKLAASILGLLALVGCQREPSAAVHKENLNIAIDTEGKITLNGSPVTEEQLITYLDNRFGPTIVEDKADEIQVVADGKVMTVEEYAAFMREKGGQ